MSDENFQRRFGRRGMLLSVIVVAAAAVLLVWYLTQPAKQVTSATNPPPSAASTPDSVTLSDSQLGSITVAAVEEREFRIEKQAVGNIDFNEDRSLPVFSPYPGRIIRAFVDLGDEVRQGQVLFTLESPDFIAAQSNLISAAATFEQASSALKRAKTLYESKALDQNDYETAVANEQSAEGALHAARHAVAVFGKTEAEIDHIVKSRQVETALSVKSPIPGRITARNAAPGLLEQPGAAPAPYSVADVSTMWMLADVPEADIADFRVGDPLQVSVMAFPGRLFAGKVTAVGAAVDPNSRRLQLRSEIKDPKHELRSQMFASFVILTGAPVRSPAVPVNGVVREGDGTMSVWVGGTDPHRFTRRTVKLGRQQDGYDQILEGVAAGERVAVDGAIFLSNILFGGAS
jgi:cobalt-zinc-cadmium efflux system membrane fusion protein